MLVYLVIYDSKAICFSPDGRLMGIGMSASFSILGSHEYVFFFCVYVVFMVIYDSRWVNVRHLLVLCPSPESITWIHIRCQANMAHVRQSRPNAGDSSASACPRPPPSSALMSMSLLTPITVELVHTLGALFPRGGPVQDSVITPFLDPVTLSSEHGTCKTVKARYRRFLGKSACTHHPPSPALQSMSLLSWIYVRLNLY